MDEYCIKMNTNGYTGERRRAPGRSFSRSRGISKTKKKVILSNTWTVAMQTSDRTMNEDAINTYPHR